MKDADKSILSTAIRRACEEDILRELEAFSRDDLNRINYYPDEIRHSSQKLGPQYTRLYHIKKLLGVLRGDDNG